MWVLKDLDVIKESTEKSLWGGGYIGHYTADLSQGLLSRFNAMYSLSEHYRYAGDFIEMHPYLDITDYSHYALEWMYELFDNVYIEYEEMDTHVRNSFVPQFIIDSQEKFKRFWISTERIKDLVIIPEERKVLAGIFDISKDFNDGT